MRALITSFLLAFGWARAAQAEELPLSLEWSAPEACGSRARVLSDVERIVGKVDGPAPARVTARAAVEELADGRWQVALVTEVEGVRGERTLVGGDCAEVRRGTALILALMINPEASLEQVDEEATEPEPAPPEPEPEPEPEPAPPEPEPEPQPAAAPMREQPLAEGHSGEASWLLGASALAGYGALPKPSVGAELRLGFMMDRLSLELQLSGWVRRRERAEELAGAGGEFDLFGVNLLAGYQAPLWPGGRARLALGGSGRRMRATGFGVSDPGSATGYWTAAVGEGSLAQELSPRLALRLRAGADLPLNPPRFAIRGVGVVHRPAPVAGFVALGLEFLF